MKSLAKIFLAILATVNVFSFTACSDDDFTATIFDAREYPLDRSSYTFPLDTFVKVNFLEPYNLKFVYKMEDIGSDLDKNLTPISYDKATVMAVMSKYLWFDVYKEVAGEEFLKEFSPRIIHLIGSGNFNPTSGTEELGTAEGGIKITLYKGNTIDASDIDYMNHYFFKTMHHEFSHIMHQNRVIPTAFNTISRSLYNPIDWQNSADSIVAGQGFVSPYASSQAREDWVEVIALYITLNDQKWNALINSAAYDWETVDYNIKDFNLAVDTLALRDTLGYTIQTFEGAAPKIGSYEGGKPKTYKIQRKVVQRNADGSAVIGEDGKPIFLDANGIDGQAIILQKLQMAREWLKTNFNIDLEKLRHEVQVRQYQTNPDGTFKLDANGRYLSHFMQPDPNDPSRTFLDTLLDEVNKFKELQK